MIHDSVASEASRLVRTVGSATLTIVVSSSAIATPRSSTDKESQVRRGTAVGKVVEAAGAGVSDMGSFQEAGARGATPALLTLPCGAGVPRAPAAPAGKDVTVVMPGR